MKPPRCCPLSDPELLEYSEEHLTYEWTMLVNSQALIGLNHQEESAPGIGAEERVRAKAKRLTAIEAYALHLRNWIEFFYPRPRLFDDDIIAADFFPHPSSWEQPAKKTSLQSAYQRASKQITHMTTSRLSGYHPDKEWKLEWLDEVGNLVYAFAKHARPHGRLHAKFLAEFSLSPP